MTATPAGTVAPLMPAIKVAVCVPSADADGVGFASNTGVADIDIVIASGEIIAGFKAQCDVVAAGCVAERTETSGRVVVAGCVAIERY